MRDRSFAPVSRTDEASVYATLVSAFADDPVERWLYPDKQSYLDRFPGFLTAFGGTAFDEHAVWRLADFAAVAMWLPPGVEPDGDAIVGYLTETVDPGKHADTYAALEQMEAAHPEFSALVSPLARRGCRAPGHGTRRPVAEVVPRHRRSGSFARVPGNPQPANRSLLRTSRFRGHRAGTSRRLPAHRVHAEIGVVAPATAMRARCRSCGRVSG